LRQGAGQITCTRLPARRFRLMVFRPFLVRMRALKPLLRARFRFEIL